MFILISCWDKIKFSAFYIVVNEMVIPILQYVCVVYFICFVLFSSFLVHKRFPILSIYKFHKNDVVWLYFVWRTTEKWKLISQYPPNFTAFVFLSTLVHQVFPWTINVAILSLFFKDASKHEQFCDKQFFLIQRK